MFFCVRFICIVHFQVITASSANDIINYERLETLGDSFLKYIVTLSLFLSFPDKDEGKLTAVKGKMVGNRNLFYCGNKIKLGNILKVFILVYFIIHYNLKITQKWLLGLHLCYSSVNWIDVDNT